jgi:hypothetical protein
MLSRCWALVVGGLLLADSVHAAGISFKPGQRGERWPRVELRREARDPKEALEGKVTLLQVTNPQRRFSPYLSAKEVGVVTLPSGRASSVIALTEVLHVPLSTLAPGRYELAVEVRAPSGEVLGKAAAAIEEAAIEALVAPSSASRGSARGIDAEAPDLALAKASAGLDPKLVVLDKRELAALPSDDARATARVFAIVVAARDAESFRQLVAEKGLKTDKGTIPHLELERQLAGGVDAFVGPPPKAPWHVQCDKGDRDRFTMRPTPQAAQAVTFERGEDGRWRVSQITKKTAPARE